MATRPETFLFGGSVKRVCAHCLFPIRWRVGTSPMLWSGWVHERLGGPYCEGRPSAVRMARPVR
jgi:hypothetical protein